MKMDMTLLEERDALAVERLTSMTKEYTAQEPFGKYFRKTASFVIKMDALYKEIRQGKTKHYTLEQWQTQNKSLYEDILPKQYDHSYGNPQYAVAELGEIHGRILSFLYTELYALIPYTFEQRLEEKVILQELLIEVYNCFEGEKLPGYRQIQQILYWFESDYSEITVAHRIREAVDPTLDFAVKIVMESDLTDLRYLYQYGEYITENEQKMAEFMNHLDEKTIEKIADTFTEGYRIGFLIGGKDLSKKQTVNLRYQIGFERVVRKAVCNFKKMGLKPIIYRAAAERINRKGVHRIGYYGAVPNRQFDYDHRADQAVYLDKAFMERRLGVMRSAYETYKTLAKGHAGPACIDTFGETEFYPQAKKEAYYLSDKQKKLQTQMDNEAVQITNRYIMGKERSFTIIAFPVPEIGAQFEEIFRETIRINTLDYQLYADIQQKMIDALDQGESVHVLGKGENHTDMHIALHQLDDPKRQTNFENCVADVNIPVGEVFTSPVLAGTGGILHVKKVYLNGLQFKDLKLVFDCGQVIDYTCSNFDTEEENRKYIEDNILHHHPKIPMGEFAIGTNTTAYVAAEKYGIADKLPILIAEKMGPHFAVGDTCYSWSEDTPVFNPDGREIIARDNEISILRKEDISMAYYGCHTDITIPYEELGSIRVIDEDGEGTSIIENGRFVLPGTEELNRPFEK